MKLFFVLGSVFAFLAVALGAFGAHGLEGKVTERMLQNWKTGVTYQMFHVGGLFVIAFLIGKLGQTSMLTAAGWLMVAGILIFSGSLYVMALTGIKVLGAITPIGGLAFLAGWVLVAIAVMKGM
ncbi:DUF423 domain-containing protein [Ectobacillus antri]|jgi:uncharacterized membrane protein YgdD (TMEM256/DUF423 family)|uniref:DUF423 domain-containing protein n=1 Tax=Ectobacillus antri TaxID=2486280 RepID=A0ABT6H5R8_9BACI|nr:MULTISPECIES: DUF423 domain-containing protein [Ectobacillus]MDG4657687.1 DUF423 domain-containing protein [Ectobacillus antri]MDG5754694.1 DUF423 domain-containing protein [Ectobacillus antri]UOY91284.1 DUF423 domain-containing protein [Ectobacillus sp. JY-23]